MSKKSPEKGLICLSSPKVLKMGKVRKNSKSGPEKVRIQHKSSEFCHYSSLGLMVRNEKFCIGPTGYSWPHWTLECIETQMMQPWYNARAGLLQDPDTGARVISRTANPSWGPALPALKISWGPPTANLLPDWSPQKCVNRNKLDQRQKVRKSCFNHQFLPKHVLIISIVPK